MAYCLAECGGGVAAVVLDGGGVGSGAEVEGDAAAGGEPSASCALGHSRCSWAAWGG